METNQTTHLPNDPQAGKATKVLRELLGNKDVPEGHVLAAATAASAEILAVAIAGQTEALKAHLEEVRKTYSANSEKLDAERKVFELQAKQLEDEMSLPKELLRTAANVGVIVTISCGAFALFGWLMPDSAKMTTPAGVAALKK